MFKLTGVCGRDVLVLLNEIDRLATTTKPTERRRTG